VSPKISKELAKHRLDQAKEDLVAAKMLYDGELYKSANNRAYYTEVFPRKMGRKIIDASNIREDSDYDDEFVVDKEKTLKQIQTAEELIGLVEEYISNAKGE